MGLGNDEGGVAPGWITLTLKGGRGISMRTEDIRMLEDTDPLMWEHAPDEPRTVVSGSGVRGIEVMEPRERVLELMVAIW